MQLVENEELMGTLIETNERIITSLEMYDTVRVGLLVLQQHANARPTAAFQADCH